MFKRIFSIGLICVLLASLLTAIPVYAASNSDIWLLNDLGIIELGEETGIIPEGFTRSDFARSLNTLDQNDPANFKYEGEEAPVWAKDIDGNKNYNHIATLLALGYMETDSENNFRPNDAITKDDAVKALVRALGYEPIVKRNGGTQAAYNALAQKLGIFSGIAVADPNGLTAMEAAELFANSMSVKFFTDANVDLSEACFWDNWDITKRTGKIFANSNLGIATEKTSSKKVNIDEVIYTTDMLIADELVGSEVSFYTVPDGTYDKVVSIFVKEKGNTLTLSSDDIEGVKDKNGVIEITYDGDETIEVSKKGFLIVNGKTMTPKAEIFEALKSGTATFVDSEGYGECDVCHVNLLFQTIIDGVNADTKTLATRYDNQVINLKEADSYEVYLGKKTASLSDLTSGMPVGIAASEFTLKDGEIVFDFAKSESIKLYASNRTDVGQIERIEDDGFVINELSKKFGSAYQRLTKGGFLAELSPGDFINAYYDSLGQLSYYEINAEGSTMRYGYLIGGDVDTKRFASSTKIKLIDTEGKLRTYETGKRFVLDGVKVDGGSKIYTVNAADDVNLALRQLIRYRVVDDVLREIDTKVVRNGVESKENSLSAELDFDITKEGNSKRRIRSGGIDRQYAFKSDCIMFIDEADTNELNPSEKDITVGKASSLTKSEHYIAGYDANSDNELSVVVRYDGYGVSGAASTKSLNYHQYFCYVVENIKESINRSGEEGFSVTLAGLNSKTSYFVSPDNLKLYQTKSVDDWGGSDQVTIYREEASNFSNVVKTGDIIRFKTNTAGDITYIEKLFDFASYKDKSEEVPNKNGTVFGHAYLDKINGDNIIYSYGEADGDTRYISKKQTRHSTSPVYYVNKQKTEMLPLSEIPSKASGNKVMVFMRYYDYGEIFDHIFYVYD